MRYLVIQVGSGVLLLAGVILHASATGSIAFGQLIGDDGLLSSASPGVVLIFLAFGIKSAFPFLHNWLQDAYPNGTVTGTVFLWPSPPSSPSTPSPAVSRAPRS